MKLRWLYLDVLCENIIDACTIDSIGKTAYRIGVVPDELFKFITEITDRTGVDPEWLLRQVELGNIGFDDLDEVIGLLSQFNVHRYDLPHSDIWDYRSIGELGKALDRVVSGVRARAVVPADVERSGARLVDASRDFIVFKVDEPTLMVDLSSGTSWPTRTLEDALDCHDKYGYFYVVYKRVGDKIVKYAQVIGNKIIGVDGKPIIDSDVLRDRR